MASGGATRPLLLRPSACRRPQSSLRATTSLRSLHCLKSRSGPGATRLQTGRCRARTLIARLLAVRMGSAFPQQRSTTDRRLTQHPPPAAAQTTAGPAPSLAVTMWCRRQQSRKHRACQGGRPVIPRLSRRPADPRHPRPTSLNTRQPRSRLARASFRRRHRPHHPHHPRPRLRLRSHPPRLRWRALTSCGC